MTDEELVKWLRNEHRKYVAGTTVTTTGYSQAADRLKALTTENERKDAALLEISGYELLKVSGFHEYSTFGEATGREYKHRIPIIAEDSFSIAKRMQSLARKALEKQP